MLAKTAEVNGPTPVVVANTPQQPISVVDLNLPARKPYMASVTASINNAQEDGVIGPKVPNGYRLLIEEASAHCTSDYGTDAVSVQGELAPGDQIIKGWYYIAPNNAVRVTNHIENYYTSQMKVWVEQGVNLTWGILADSHPKQSLSCELAVSGELIAVQ